MTQALKEAVAKAALAYLPTDESIIGVGSGSTVNAFIDQLAEHKASIGGIVSASKASTERLQAHRLPVIDLNSVSQLPIYFDGADAISPLGYCLKGGGGALTSEKIIASASKTFVCMVDQSKVVQTFRDHAVTIEVLAEARSLVARACVTMGGNPIYREGFETDHGHVLLDVYDLPMDEPIALSAKLNGIPGVVAHGLFVEHKPTMALIATDQGIITQSYQ